MRFISVNIKTLYVKGAINLSPVCYKHSKYKYEIASRKTKGTHGEFYN